MEESIQISTLPPATKSQDFEHLREQGMNIVRSVASGTWTDHNLHDPGITLLEACCYALTEMGLRTGMDMRDLVASDVNGRKAEFFTAAQVLPVSPVTINDFRKVLIDHELVQDAWVHALESKPKGRLSVLLQFEDDTLNTSAFSLTVTPVALGSDYNIDLAFPYWDDEDAAPFTENVTLNSVVFDGLPGNEWNLIGSNAYFARINVNYTPSSGPAATKTLWIIAQITTPVPNPLTDTPFILADLTARVISLIDNSPTDLALVRKFNRRTTAAFNSMKVVRRYIEDYRNLCENLVDYKAVRLQQIGVSAIIEINPGVNLESLLADIFFNIDGFISPINKFHHLDELLAAYTPDNIFEGPSMLSGFLQNEALSAAIPDVLYTSDMLRLILQQRDQRGTDIIQREDVNSRNIAAVRNLSLANYLDNRPITSNARDCLQLVESQRHVPRLSLTKSRIVFYRNQVEVKYDLARVIELFNEKKAVQLAGLGASFSDIPLPQGQQYPVTEYYPIQNDLPLIYGVGEAGLPDTATQERRALAMQLKGYMFFFEQLTSGIASQLANINSFFSADPSIDKTFFQQPLYHLPQVDKLLLGFNPATQTWDNFQQDAANSYMSALQRAGESPEQFLTRRNRILNHLLAIFGEDMYDAAALAYHEATIVPDSATLSLADLIAKQTAQRNLASRHLISAKSAFFYDLPALNRDRAQSYGNPLWRNPDLLRIQPAPGGFDWSLVDAAGNVLLNSAAPAASENDIPKLAVETLSLATNAANYATRVEGPQLRIVIRKPPALTTDMLQSVGLFATPALANTGIANMVQAIIQLWVQFALSPLEKRMYHMLGLPFKERRVLMHVSANYFEIFNQPPPPPPFRKRFRLWEQSGFGGLQLLTGDIDYTAAADPDAITAARAGIQTAISRGVHVDSFDIINPLPNQFTVVLLMPDGTVLARSPLPFATRELAQQHLVRTWLHIFRLFSNQGFYMVEHLLVAPVTTTGAELSNVNIDEPYSFQISFVFPSGYERNFAISPSPKQPIQPEKHRDPEFRKYAEQQIRKACPAHILPRVLWADSPIPGSPLSPNHASFINFENSYRAWLAAYMAEGVTEAVIGPLRNQLVTVLNNIYKLHEA
ncbi:MAG: hypothetical protein WCF67_10220 [Chitinophagaceae bacterium]